MNGNSGRHGGQRTKDPGDGSCSPNICCTQHSFAECHIVIIVYPFLLSRDQMLRHVRMFGKMKRSSLARHTSQLYRGYCHPLVEFSGRAGIGHAHFVAVQSSAKVVPTSVTAELVVNPSGHDVLKERATSHGSFSVRAGERSTHVIDGLVSGEAYDVYFVVEVGTSTPCSILQPRMRAN